jgi:hypothetical protein
VELCLDASKSDPTAVNCPSNWTAGGQRAGSECRQATTLRLPPGVEVSAVLGMLLCCSGWRGLPRLALLSLHVFLSVCRLCQSSAVLALLAGLAACCAPPPRSAVPVLLSPPLLLAPVLLFLTLSCLPGRCTPLCLCRFHPAAPQSPPPASRCPGCRQVCALNSQRTACWSAAEQLNKRQQLTAMPTLCAF